MINEELTRNHLVTRRTFMLRVAKLGITFTLGIRLLYLQLIKGSEFRILSDKNRISLVATIPRRGAIKDKFGLIIADSRPCFLVYLDKRLSKNYLQSFNVFAGLANLPEATSKKLLAKIRKTPKRSPVLLFSDISWHEVAIIEEQAELMPAIYVEQISSRDYKIPEPFSHVTGYVGKISEDEMLSSTKIAKFDSGKTGLEKYYNNYLAGSPGYQKIEIDANGILVRELERLEPSAGIDLETNIDARLQEMIYNIMPAEGASAIVIDISTGGILASVSKGGYNPNDFARGIDSDTWNQLNNNLYKPLINKICASQYPPGSTFKLITILAALNAGIPYSQKFFCAGYMKLGNRNFNCWKKEGHGLLDMKEAIKQSCNCYMFNISKIIKIDAILDMARKFGLGSPVGIDLPFEAKGFVPDRAWKLQKFKYDWSTGDGFNLSIGQGALLATPLQLVNLVAKIASNGLYNKAPKIAYKDLGSDTNLGANLPVILQDIKQEYFEFIKLAMDQTVNQESGSGFHHRSNIVRYAGKTGTSQVVAKKNAHDDLSSEKISWTRRNHALFSGFFPIHDPKYSMSIIVDHGGGGSRAACPIAKAIVEFCANNHLV
ncbi:MAG: penicillin-binding protein 2 [Rickettsiaceae bacterium]|nr:penicillin-binding protein 2 [Rickettsiaceae bacterium]